MINEKRLIDAYLKGEVPKIKTHFAEIIVRGKTEKPYYNIIFIDPQTQEYEVCFGSYSLENVRKWLSEEFEIVDAPTTDFVPVDEIRVDIMSLSLENQEAILNVSICGKPNEVKIPFSKEVAEVVHGRWIWKGGCFHCSNCKTSNDHTPAYCEGCGAKMGEVRNGRL